MIFLKEQKEEVIVFLKIDIVKKFKNKLCKWETTESCRKYETGYGDIIIHDVKKL